ncbi:MAG: PAC2 family protein [Nanoarchaeota archaeon]|nr:PAC2 family protein [Nanoarchaeota archaeon]
MIKIKQISNPKLNSPILIEGLPGIGNVGKITTDFLIDSLEAKKFIEITSYYFPNSVFVNEDNLIDLPSISIYYKKIKNKDFLFIAGDVQPIDETGCYLLCEKILDIFQKYKGKEIITLGGIGLPKIPNNPKVYCTANNKQIIKKYKTETMDSKIFGTVGPIMGITGLLVGLAQKRNISSICLLAQTFGHPTYIGIKGSRELLKILNEKLNLNINLGSLDKEIKSIEKELKTRTQEILSSNETSNQQQISYIG